MIVKVLSLSSLDTGVQRRDRSVLREIVKQTSGRCVLVGLLALRRQLKGLIDEQERTGNVKTM